MSIVSIMSILIFGALFIFGVWLLYCSRDLIRLGLASTKWAKTQGLIVDSYDNSFFTPGINNTNTGVVSARYRETAHVYEYLAGGRMHRCSKYCFGGWADRLAAAYSIGTVVTVYYDPKQPEQAVLKPGIQLGAIFGIVPIATALLWLYFSLRG